MSRRSTPPMYFGFGEVLEAQKGDRVSVDP